MMEVLYDGVLSKKQVFKWVIKDVDWHYGGSLRSPAFRSNTGFWHLTFSPSGAADGSCISLGVEKLSNLRETLTYFDIGIKLPNGSEKGCTNVKAFTDAERKYTWTNFLTREELRLLKESGKEVEISYEIQLPVEDESYAEMEAPGDPYSQLSAVSWRGLVHDMKNLFLSQTYCDIVIKIKEREFPVHRVILAARSRVFAAMFEHGVSENRNDILEINDAEPDIFRDFLLFLYCGEVEELSSDKVYGLYDLADKYHMVDLKQECVKFMKCNLSLETVCNVLLLSEKYGEEQLNDLAKSFVFENANAVLSSDQWKTLEVQNQLLANQFLKN